MTKVSFEAPGPGTWELDTTHLQKPVTRYTSTLFPEPLVRGFKHGTERYGLFLSHLKSTYIHGFNYHKPVLAFVPEDAPPGPPPEGFFEQPELVERFDNGPRAIEKKLWREDLRLWDEEVKPDSIRRNQALQDVIPENLDLETLIAHLIECRENLAEMWYRHHQFTIPSIMPTGLYLVKACEWTGVTPGEALELLKGSSPVSAGLAAAELAEAANLIRQENIDSSGYRDLTPGEILPALAALPAPVGPAVAAYIDIVSYQLTSGYDITERYALETPEILVANIWSEVAKSEAAKDSDNDEVTRHKIRDKVPAEYRAEFDSLLEEAQLINRLRDERGVYNEAKAFGLARRAVLEAGRRLENDDRLDQASLFLHASHEEMLALLRGENGPSASELKTRKDWYETRTIDDAPSYLGPPPEPPPPPEALPENARLAYSAIGVVLGNVFDPPVAEETPGEVVKGFPVSPGSYEGVARIIHNPSDFHRLQPGDVLVTRNTSATFNVVLPMLGALVTDRGGQLSHAAIVAREYGIPGIVSTRNATRAIADGARVRVDGAAGTVEVLS